MSALGSRKAPFFGYARDPLLQPWLNKINGASSHVARPTNDFLRAIRIDGSLAFLDYLLLPLAVDTPTTPLVDIIGLRAASLVNSPTVAPYQGITGNGTTQSFNSIFNPGDGGSYNYQRNSACFGAYVQTNDSRTAGNPAYMGTSNSGNTFVRAGATTTGWAVNVVSGVNTTVSPTTGIGLAHFERSAANLSTFYQNGASQGTQAGASIAVLNQPFYGLAANNGSGTAVQFNNGTLSLVFAGASMGATLAALFSIRAKTLMQAIGGPGLFP